MRTDPIAFFRFVLRSGDIGLAERLARALVADPRYHERALAELSALGFRARPRAHATPGGRMLDSLLDRLAPPGQN